MRYGYYVKGTAKNDQTWSVSGSVIVPEFNDAFNAVMLDGFQQLTQGNAVFGSPGVGCAGPYSITELHITKGDRR